MGQENDLGRKATQPGAGEFKTLRGGNVRLFRRLDSPKIFARIKADDGTWQQRSTRTDDVDVATAWAEEQAVFSLPDGTQLTEDQLRGPFRKFLNAADMLNDDLGKPRTLYSLRHTYATHQLLAGDVSIYELAEQMGTSLRMIQDHYGHVKPLQVAGKFAEVE